MSVLNWLREFLWFVDGDDLVMKDSLFVLNDLLNCNKKHQFVNFGFVMENLMNNQLIDFYQNLKSYCL
jgi:hypothetical protein